MIRFVIILLPVFCLLQGCGTDDSDQLATDRNDVADCSNILSACIDGNGSYCLFGFKWGETNPIGSGGFDVTGPQEGAEVTYSFQVNNGMVSTHSQANLRSRSLEGLPSCAREEFQNALQAWADVANINFTEMPDNSDTDIKFYTANILQGGVGYPNYLNMPCSSIAGNVVINANINVTNCESLRKLFMHEIGHVLGLGHVLSNNIMHWQFSTFRTFEGPQSGDIEGVVQLYGER